MTIPKLRSLTLLIFFLLAFSAATNLVADVLYVGSNGNDSRGRETAKNRNTPWRTIQRGVNEASAGDMVIVLNGHYNEHVSLFRSGQPGAPIRLAAENVHGATLNGSIRGNDIAYVNVERFRVANWRQDGPTTRGISFNRCHHLLIRQNRVYDCRGAGISCDQSDSLLIEWNVVYRNAFWEINQQSGISIYQPQYRGPRTDFWGITIRNNVSYLNENKVNNPDFGRPTDGNGIAVDDFKNIQAGGNGQVYDRPTLIANNLSFNNGGQGIHCYLANNVYVRNNTTYNNMKSFDFGGEVSVSESNKVYVYNNVLFARNGKNVSLQFDSTNVWWDYNLLHNGPVFNANNGPNTIYANPQFQTNTLRPGSSSPAIGRGITHSGIYPYDVRAKPRVTNGRIDLGAYELE